MTIRLAALCIAFATATFAGVAFAPHASADSITIDFDSLDPDSSGVLNGSAVTNYLAGYGVSISGMVNGEVPNVLDTAVVNYIVAPSAYNVFQVSGPNTQAFTMNFSTAVDNFSFVRAGVSGANSPTGTNMAAWSATAYDASNTSLGSVSSGSIFASAGADVAAQSYAWNTTGISYITFSCTVNGAGYGLPTMDNLTFTSPVPEPGTLALFGLGAAGLAWRRRRAARA